MWRPRSSRCGADLFCERRDDLGDVAWGIRCLAGLDRGEGGVGIVAELELDDEQWLVSFQSRVGREEWLKPYTEDVLVNWGKDQLGKIDVVCPGFAADCLETLEEIEVRGAASFVSAGGGELRYTPALNAREDHVAFLSRTIEKNVAGWPEASTDWSHSEAARRLEKSLQRARAMGAER